MTLGVGLVANLLLPCVDAAEPGHSPLRFLAPSPTPSPNPLPEPGIGSALKPAESAAGQAEEAPIGEGTLLGDWGGLRTRLDDHGITLAPVYTVEGLANVNGGQKRGAVAEGLLRLDLDVDTERLAGLSGGTLHASSLYLHGDSLTQKYVGDLFTLSNIDAWDTWVLFELWWEQQFRSKEVSLRLGLLAADEEFASTEYGGLFINGTCGWPAIIAVNVPSPAYPYAALGARLAWEPSPHWHFRAAAFDGAPDVTDDEGRNRDHHGLSTELDDGALFVVEAMRTWHEAPTDGLPGDARLGFWYHTAEFADLRQASDGRSLADPLGSGEARLQDGNWGVYGTFEQQVTREGVEEAARAQGLGVFTRLGGTPSDRNLLNFYAEAGLHYQGLLPGRDEDRCGVAVVYGRISDAVRGLARDARAFTGTDEELPDHEMILEGEYRFHLGHGVCIQPGLHWIMHPGGSGATPDALVLSLRATFEL